ncbi:MAG: GNAT family protein [Acidobacteriota bacterium]
MHLELTTCVLRSWKTSDAEALVRYANNRNIWLNLRDRFPHPYTPRDALRFFDSIFGQEPETVLAIDVGGEAIGGVGYALQKDVDRVSAELGYWIGEPFWGRGIATEVVKVLTGHALARHQLTRVFGMPFSRNVASCRVLEKAGYVFEGTLRRSAIKDGVILDQCLYGYIP